MVKLELIVSRLDILLRFLLVVCLFPIGQPRRSQQKEIAIPQFTVYPGTLSGGGSRFSCWPGPFFGVGIVFRLLFLHSVTLLALLLS